MGIKSGPLVSVIIPSYNAGEFIRQTISSVLSQTFGNIEVIIIDDSSTDNTVGLVRELGFKDSRIRYFVQGKRAGVSAARNRGIKESKGDLIAFIDHDDLWMPEKLQKQVPLFYEDPEVGLVFSREAIMAQDGRIKGLVGGFGRPLRGRVFRELFVKHFIPMSTVVIKKDVFDSLDEWFPESMEMAEEVDIFLRIAYRWKIDYCDEVLANWRDHPKSDSKLRLELLIKDYHAILGKLSAQVPDFKTLYRKEIYVKQRWIDLSEIKIMLSRGERQVALEKTFLFFRKYAFYPKALLELPILFASGFTVFDKVRMLLINLYARSPK